MLEKTNMPPSEAWVRLMAGNERFATSDMRNVERCDEATRASVLEGQQPFAAVLACADSRVSPEHVFDVGLGELFVCRNAGNLLDEIIVGSLEFAVVHAGAPLVCIMGHTSCGAANAAVAFSRDIQMSASHNIDDVLIRLVPAVTDTRGFSGSDSEWADEVARKNVELMGRQLLQRSPLLGELVRHGTIEVVGLVYNLSSGRVEVILPPSWEIEG